MRREFINTGLGPIHAVVAGEGPPVLLLHGFPQTHVMWHPVAPALASRFMVVLADLPGYGDSAKPAGDPEHRLYAKRSTAAALVEVMDALGHDRFAVVGHDRGGRIAHRMALDHEERVDRLAVLDIVPTLTVFDRMSRELALAYWHWSFLAQPAPLPERMIGVDKAWFLDRMLSSIGTPRDVFAIEAVAEYARCFDDATVHAICEDYRAAATVDLDDDRADEAVGHRIACPTLALWGSRGPMHRIFDIAACWKERTDGPCTGVAVDAGHFLVEEAPEETMAHLLPFLEVVEV